MAPKLEVNENLSFLYLCLKKSDYNAIDFAAVGATLNIKTNAARMRFSRLKQALDGADSNVKKVDASDSTLTASPAKAKKRKSEGKEPAEKKVKVEVEDYAINNEGGEEAENDAIKNEDGEVLGIGEA